MRLLFFFTLALFLTGCASHRENIMFEVQEGHTNRLEAEIWNLSEAHKIQPMDLLEVKVVNKSGEILIDPEFQVKSNGIGDDLTKDFSYRVNKDGIINMPMVGSVQLIGMTIPEAETEVGRRFLEKYNEPFVQIKHLNKRVYVLGASGGKVVPLANEHTTLVEILAISGGVDINGRADNIRLIRENEVIVADLSSVDGIKYSNLSIQPNDIIYIEPVRRPFVETLREYNPIIGFITGIVSITALIISTR